MVKQKENKIQIGDYYQSNITHEIKDSERVLAKVYKPIIHITGRKSRHVWYAKLLPLKISGEVPSCFFKGLKKIPKLKAELIHGETKI